MIQNGAGEKAKLKKGEEKQRHEKNRSEACALWQDPQSDTESQCQ
jgi:hypothetical protein